MPETLTECLHCGETFRGNFCPRCGQSAATTQIKTHNAFNIFLNTWGFGDNSFLRVVRDLLLRPGYMIGDLWEQADFLKGRGCTEMQGYHFYKPMPVQDFEKLEAAPAQG